MATWVWVLIIIGVFFVGVINGYMLCAMMIAAKHNSTELPIDKNKEDE